MPTPRHRGGRPPIADKKQAQILDMLEKGFTYRQISSKTKVSLTTVMNYAKANGYSVTENLRKLHNEILIREREMGSLDEQLEAAMWPTRSPQAMANIERQNKLGEEITNLLWEVRSQLFDL